MYYYCAMSTEGDEQDELRGSLAGVNLNALARITGLSRRTLHNARTGAHSPHRLTRRAILRGLAQLRKNESKKRSSVHLEDAA